MNEQEINVIAKLKLKKDAVNEAKKLLNDLQFATRKEPGCNSYQLHQSIDDETVFVLYESWIDKSKLDNHFQTPHFKQWEQASVQFVAGPPEVTIMKKVHLK